MSCVSLKFVPVDKNIDFDMECKRKFLNYKYLMKFIQTVK